MSSTPIVLNKISDQVRTNTNGRPSVLSE